MASDLLDWKERCETRPVRLVGGPCDGEYELVEFIPALASDELEPVMSGLLCVRGDQQATYGPARLQGGEWVRPLVSVRPIRIQRRRAEVYES